MASKRQKRLFEASHTPAANEKRRVTMLNLWATKKHQKKMKLANKDTGRRVSLKLRGLKRPPRSKAHCKKISQNMLTIWEGRRQRGEIASIAKKVSKSIKYRIATDAVYREIVLASALKAARVCGGLKPNYGETKLNSILRQNFPGEFRMNVDGKVTIAGKIPDFVNVNGRKALVELFGRHWHKDSEERTRKALFQKWGFSTLVIWAEELKEHFKVVSRIERFLRRCGS